MRACADHSPETREILDEIGHPALASAYLPVARIGEGTFSTVYKAIDVNHAAFDNSAWIAAADAGAAHAYVALKLITRTTAPCRVASELRFLQELNGINNVIPLITCLRFRDSAVAVFPYIKYTDFRTFLRTCALRDIKAYMRSLLIAASHIHSHGIVHRDIKPSNFLFSMETGRGFVIDFGLSHREDSAPAPRAAAPAAEGGARQVFFFSSVDCRSSAAQAPPGYVVGDPRPQMAAVRSGTRGFRAPEVLFRVERQTRAIDVWSVGVIFLTVLSGQYPFFASQDDTNALVELASVYGHSEMRSAARYYKKTWRSNITECPEDRVPFRQVVRSLKPAAEYPDDAFDLLDRLLELRDAERISAREALEHPFLRL